MCGWAVFHTFEWHHSGKMFNMVFYKNYDEFKMYKISCPQNM